MFPMEIIEVIKSRLLAKREIAGDCWLWTGAHLETGYGHMWHPGEKKVRRVPRLAYEAWNGPLPDGRHVMHTCDTPACFNPEHLVLGSRADNMVDASTKGRLGRPTRDKLTEEQVIAVAADSRSLRVIGREYGISGSHVHAIKHGQRGARVTDPKYTGRYKLTAAQVRAIREDFRPHSEIAAEHGIARSTVSRIRAGKRRGHVSP